MKKYFFLFIFCVLAQDLFAQAPVITSFSPTMAGPGDTVIINGANFINVNEVRLGGYLVSYQVVSSSTILAFEAAGELSGDVTVTTDSGTATLPGFVWNGTPVITSISPNIASAGKTITITGKYLAFGLRPTVQSVSFGGIPAASFTALSTSVVTAVVGNGASGIVSVTSVQGTANFPGFIFSSSCAATTATIDQSICASQLPYYWGKHFLFTQGTYKDTLVNIAGCDSIVTLNLEVHPSAVAPIVVNASRCGNGTVNLSATLSGATDQLKWFSDSTLTQLLTTGTNFITPFLSATTNYFITETTTSGCSSKAVVVTATINTTTAPPKVDSIVRYYQTATALSLTATANAGDTLLWYTVATGGVASKTAPVPPTTILGSTDYYVSRKNTCGESPRAKIAVIIESVVPTQLCAPYGSTSITSNLTGAHYQWQLNVGFGFNNITNDSNYIGVADSTLQLINIPSYWNGYQYRCVVNGTNSNVYTLQFIDTWIGTTDSTWSNAANWSCGKIPNNYTDVIINSGANVVLKSNATVKSLTVNPGAVFTVSPGFTLTITH